MILSYQDETIGIIRNPYERVVSAYFKSLNYKGLDLWVKENPLQLQTEMYQECDHLVRLEAWEEELKFKNLHPKDTSILSSEEITPMWDRWYTLKTKTLVYLMYQKDIETYGYSF